MKQIEKSTFWGNEKTDINKLILLVCKFFIFAVSLSYLLSALSKVYYHEIDSYMLPVLSMQYRNTIVITQEDIERAKIDFPELYIDINGFDDLRSSGLNKINDNEWLSFYFPAYSAVCLPAKLILQALNMDQSKAFTITNAFFVTIALIAVYRYLNVKPAEKLIALILLAVSPIYMYIEYISSEAFIYSMIIISLLLYSNGKYKTSAFVLSAASMNNPTVMGIGIVMVAEYLIKMFRNRNQVKIFSVQNIVATIKYASCYLICLVPFIVNYIYLRTGNPTSGGATLKDYGERFIAYLFSVDIGFFSFAPVTLLLFFVLIGITVLKKKYQLLVYPGFVLLPMMAYSLMIYIDCVPVFCARYIMWTYPALVICVIILFSQLDIKLNIRYLAESAAILSTVLMVLVNKVPMHHFDFNNTSYFLLDNCPSLYSPYYGTFYSRNDKINWPYSSAYNSFYFSREDGNLRKILIESTDEQKSKVFDSIKGDNSSVENLMAELNKIPSDGKLHYVNISPHSNIELKEKTLEEKGEVFSKEILYSVKEPFVISQNSKYKADVELKPAAIYKIDIKIADKHTWKDISEAYISVNNNFNVDVMDFIQTEDNRYVLVSGLIYVGDDNENKLSEVELYSPHELTVESFEITEMENSRYVMKTDDDVIFSGNMEEDTVLYPLELEPMRFYRICFEFSNPEDFSESDSAICSIHYEKRFNHNLGAIEINEKNREIMLFSGDTTIAKEPVYYLKITGATEKPITIDSVVVSVAS